MKTDAALAGSYLNHDPAVSGVATLHVYAVASASDNAISFNALPVFSCKYSENPNGAIDFAVGIHTFTQPGVIPVSTTNPLCIGESLTIVRQS